MAVLTMKYERKNFFGHAVYTEDECKNPELKDIKKCFYSMDRNYTTALQLLDDVYFWDSMKDYENNIITVRHYDVNRSYTEERKSFEKCKKEVYAKWRE